MKKVLLYSSPVGPLYGVQEDAALCGLHFGEPEGSDMIEETPLLQETGRQLAAYFAGELREFHLPLRPRGTAFQQKVWEALLEIPYGETRSYGHIAARVGNPRAARAVGMANHRNPIAIIIPCHRCIGADGSLVGYGTGQLAIKRALLDLERKK